MVAPYAAEARMVQMLVRDKLGVGSADFVSTVHRFQGNEKGTMIVDLPDAVGAPLGLFMKAVRLTDEGTRLLNVAVSRAREQVVVIANLAYFREHKSAGATVLRLLNHMEGTGARIDARTLLESTDDWWLDGRGMGSDTVTLDDAGPAGIFAAPGADTMFAADATRSRRSIVVFSPTLATASVEAWSAALDGARNRGVVLRVVTRPPSEQPYAARAIQLLGAIGVSVDYRAKMTTNLAIVDASTLWHGTLHLLGERHQGDYLIRLPAPHTCAQLARFLATPGAHADVPELDGQENPHCPRCGERTIWYAGGNSIYFSCLAGCKEPIYPEQVARMRRKNAAQM